MATDDPIQTTQAEDIRRRAGDYNHHASRSVSESYEIYEEMRGTCPVAHSDQLGGFYLINDYADVRKAARDWQTYSSAQSVFLPRLAEKFPMIDNDPPEQGWWRALVKDELSVAGVRRFQGPMRDEAERIIDEFIEDGECDLIAALCEPLPVAAVCMVLGVDRERVPEVRPIAIELFDAMSDPELFDAAFAKFAAFALQEMEDRRANPRDDLLTRLATEEHQGRRAADAEMLVFLVGLLTAGHHTTTSAMASLFYRIATDAAIRDTLIADPRAIRTATEETIRLNTPLHVQFRETTREAEIGGRAIPADCPVGLNFAAANRDPKIFEGADEFRLDRSPNPHLGFGYGIHTCVGAPLSRLEIHAAVEALLTRAPDVRIDVDPAGLDYRFVGGNLAMLHRLPIRFSPTPRAR